MERCDALIVGGGPAGSSCARILSAAGMNVRVLDRETFPRNKVCAGWITPPVLGLVEMDAEEYAEGRVFQPITGFRTGLVNASRSAVETRYDRVVSYGIRRLELDDYLLRRSGADLHLGLPVSSLVRKGDSWVVNGSIRTPVLVGAGGHFCPVGRFLSPLPARRMPVVLAQETEFRMDGNQKEACRVSGEMPELYFCRDLKGYGWAFRKGDYLNVGLGREDPRGLAEHVSAFYREMVAHRNIPAEPGGPFRGHAYHLYHHAARPLLDHGVLLVGDAAGLAYTESGEGIRPAVESGLMAAETILEADGKYGRDRLEPYRDRLRERFGRNGRGIRDLVPQALKASIGRRLLPVPWFARHVVMDRWFLRTGDV